jgi:hypothetical protein
MFHVIPDEYAILLMDHHDSLMDAYPVCLIGKPGGIIQAEFLQKMFFLGKKETGILTARKEDFFSACNNCVFDPRKEDMPPFRHPEICHQEAVILSCIAAEYRTRGIAPQPVGIKPL